MAEYREDYTWVDRFDRAQTFTTTSTQNGWTIADTSAAGAPTYLCVDGGGATLTMAADNEVENLCLYTGDVLPFYLNQIRYVEFLAKVGATIGSASTLAFGIGSARNDTLDSVATNAWFRMEGGTSTTLVVVETDDGTTDLDDKATGATLSTTIKQFRIDFTAGLADVRFFIDGARVASGTTFSMAAASSSQKVQPIIQISKTASTNTTALNIQKVEFGLSKYYS